MVCTRFQEYFRNLLLALPFIGKGMSSTPITFIATEA